ncbi:Protein trichome birefringence-like 34, partial [Mucuna pruriens]
MMRVVENVLDDLKGRGLNVQMLNIRQLSDCRKEGHPSIYRKQLHHWCLPGVPAVWNELLLCLYFPSITNVSHGKAI